MPKPIDPPDEADFKAAKFTVYEAKLKIIELVNKENQEYLASDECCDFLDGLLSIMSKTVLNFIAKNKSLLHDAMIDWLKEAITKSNPVRNAESLKFFTQQVMAVLIPSTCFPDIDLPEDIDLSIMDQHKNACMTGTTR